MRTSRSPLCSLLLIPLLIALSTSCETRVDIFSQEVVPKPQASIFYPGDYLLPTDSCQWLRSYHISYEILDSAEFMGHDFSIRVLPGSPTNADSCQCDSLIYCVTLSFPIQEVEEAGFKNEIAPFQTVVANKDSFGGYENFRDPRFSLHTNQIQHTICGKQAAGRVLYLDLWNGFPYGYNLADALVEVEGICIVANLEDTQEEETEENGGSSEGNNND